MPASIRVVSGISAGTSYWVDRPVLRIGSDPTCEICLPSADLAPHALTLEYRAGQYRAYNRGTSPIRVGATALAPGGNGVWDEAQALHLPGDLRLVLDIDGDPQPSPPPETPIDDGYAVEGEFAPTTAAAPSATAPATKKSSSTAIQLAVIVVCVLAMAAFLTMGRGGGSARANRPSFAAIVTKLQRTEDESTRFLLRRLQYAEAALVRGNSGVARQRYENLRDRMMRQEDEPLKGDRKLVRDFVEYRLGQLR